jgi:hypothetical protein
MANVADILFQFGQKEKAAVYLAQLRNVAPNHPKVLKMLEKPLKITENRQRQFRCTKSRLKATRWTPKPSVT